MKRSDRHVLLCDMSAAESELNTVLQQMDRAGNKGLYGNGRRLKHGGLRSATETLNEGLEQT